MRRLLLILILLFTLGSHSQVTILNKTNLNGFNITTYGGSVTKSPSGLIITGSIFCCYLTVLDTALNLVGYDSLHVIFDAKTYSNWYGYASVNNTYISAASSYTLSTTNITNLILTCTVTTGVSSHGRTLIIENLKIIGFPSIGTSVQESNVNDYPITYANRKLQFDGEIKTQKLNVYDVLGNVRINKSLEYSNDLDLETGVYLIRVIDGNKVFFNKKLFINNSE